MGVNKITQEIIEKIRKNSVMPLPVNASERGLSSSSVKNAIYAPIEMLTEEVNRIVDELNNYVAISVDGCKVQLDTIMSSSSTNPVQNKAIKTYIDEKITSSITDALTADYTIGE